MPSKYDKEREKLGLKPASPSSSTTRKSKYDEERQKYLQPEPTAQELARQWGLGPLDIRQSPIMQQAREFAAQQAQQPRDERGRIQRALDYVFRENPVARVIQRPFQALARASVPDAPRIGVREDGTYGALPGPTAREAFVQRNPMVSTGSQTVDKVADVIGEAGSYLFNPAGGIGQGAVGVYRAVSPAVDRVTSRITTRLPALGQRVTQEAAREAVTAAAYAPSRALIEGETDPADIARRTAIEGALGAGTGAAFPLIGAAIRPIQQRINNELAFRRAIDDFIQRTQAPRGEEEFVAFPRERIEQRIELPSGGEEEAATRFRRREEYEREFQKAVDDQYEFLKQSLENRQGVEPGVLIRDPITGEVIDRVGRISYNPRWYQEFYEQYGRAPTNAELRQLAEEQVRRGFQDDYGQVPAWKPEEIQRIDEQIAEINEALPYMQGEVRSELERALENLQRERAQAVSALPEGIQAMRVTSNAPTVERVNREQLEFDLPITNQQQPVQRIQPPENLPEVPQRKSEKPDVEPIDRNTVIENLKKNLDVTIDTGRLGIRNRAVMGIFKQNSEVVRSRIMHDIETISHEVGHALQKRFKLVDPQFNEEFRAILRDHSNVDVASYKPSELPEEGFAEYMRLFFTDPQTALSVAPRFTSYFLSKLPPQILRGLRATQNDIQRWINQSGFYSAMGKIDFTRGSSKRRFNFQRFYTKTIDDLTRIGFVMDAILGKRSHLTKSAEENLYKLARLSHGTAERAKLAITEGIFNENGEKMVEGLGNIVRDLEKIGVTEQELSTYLAVLHAQDLKQMGKKVPFTDAEIQAVLDELDSQAMRNIQQRIVKYNNALLDLLVESGFYSQEAVNRMRQMYPNYVPFMRFFDDDLEEGFRAGGYGTGSGFANLLDPIKRMSEEGSERTLIDPLESMVKNTFVVMNAAAKNRVGMELVRLANMEGAGKFVEIVPGGKSAKEHVINVRVGGESVAVKVRDPDFYDAILSLDNETANTLIRFLGAATNVLRGGATLTPEFIVRNAIRDVFSAMVNVGFNPLDFARGFFYAISPGLRRMGFNIDNRVYEQFVSAGGAMSTLWGSSRDYTREAMREAFRKSIQQKAKDVVTNPKQLLKVWRPAVWLLKALRTGAEISELSTKLGKFKRELDLGKSPLEAAFQARDLMDFNRAGSTIRSANRLIAFLNANLQGTDKMIREFVKDPVAFMMRGMLTLTLPTIGLHAWYAHMPEEQKKAYQNIPNYQKDLFFIIPGPDNTFIRIPKPFEAGLIFSSSVDRVLRDLWENDPEAYKDYFTNLATTFTPPVMIQFFNPILEALSNYSFFRNAPIVPMSLQDEQRKFQYDVFTSETAKLIGQAMDRIGLGNTPFASPKIIDNTIYGYTAGLGRYATAGLDQIINAFQGGPEIPKPERTPEQNPFLSPFLARTQGSGQIRNNFFDRYEELKAARTSARSHPEVEYDEKEYQRFNKAYNQMRKYSTRYKEILNSPNLTPQEKRARLDVLDQQMNDLAYQTLYGVKR